MDPEGLGLPFCNINQCREECENVNAVEMGSKYYQHWAKNVSRAISRDLKPDTFIVSWQTKNA